MSQLLSSQQSAQLIGMSKSTIKRMCDTGVLASTRTPGGHRRVAKVDLQRWARENGIQLRHDRGMLPRSAGALTSGDVQMLLTDGHAKELAVRMAGEIRTGNPLASILDSVVAPACWDIGKRWESKALDPYEEHVRSRTLLEAMTHLRDGLSRSYSIPHPTGSKVGIGAALGSELHHIASNMIEAVMLDAGWQATSLGAMLPVESLILALEETSPHVVWVSYTCIDDADAVVEDNHRLFSMLAPGQRLVIGGQALTRDLRCRMRFHFAGDSLCHLHSYLQTICPNR